MKLLYCPLLILLYIFTGEISYCNDTEIASTNVANKSNPDEDQIWMLNIFEKHDVEGYKLSQSDLDRISKIYNKSTGSVKAYALSFLVYSLDVDGAKALILDCLTSDDIIVRKQAVESLYFLISKDGGDKLLVSEELKTKISDLYELHQLYLVEKRTIMKLKELYDKNSNKQ